MCIGNTFIDPVGALLPPPLGVPGDTPAGRGQHRRSRDSGAVAGAGAGCRARAGDDEAPAEEADAVGGARDAAAAAVVLWGTGCGGTGRKMATGGNGGTMVDGTSGANENGFKNGPRCRISYACGGKSDQ